MWYFAEHNTRQGPLSLEEIQTLMTQGAITAETLVWKHGMAGWQPAAETELRDFLPEDLPPPLPIDLPPPLPHPSSKRAISEEPQLELGRLLRDSLSYVGSVYLPMLVFFVPSLFVSILMAIASVDGSVGVFVLLSLITYTCITPFASGASIFYVQRKLLQQDVTIADAMQRATENFVQLVLATILLWLILIPACCLVIPGIYLSIRLSFIYYSVMIEGRTASSALQRSWELTQGRWGQIFLAFLLLILIVCVPAFIVGAILGLLFGELHPVISQSVGGIIGMAIGPILAVYYVFLFMSLVNLASSPEPMGEYR